MKNIPITFITVLLSFILIPATSVATPVVATEAQSACTARESWKFGTAISQDWRDNFKNFISKKTSPAEGLAQALALRRFSRSQEGRLLGEYWIARSLFEAGFIHTAYTGFGLIAAYPLTDAENFLGIQIAALDCLNKIYDQYPSLPFAQPVASRIPFYLNHTKQRSIAWTFAASLFQNQLNYNRPQTELQLTLKLLSGSGMHEALAQAWLSARNHNPAATIAALEKQTALSDQSRLLLARSYYAVGAFTQGAAQLKLIQKSSNELAKALSELEWHYLLDERYSEAIGTAMSLQAGGLRHTFTPESLMVMAMALNELCQFPESLKAISSFRKNYEKPYLWLKNWEAKTRTQTNLYQLSVQFLKKQSQVPDRVATEWVRSPVFLSHQDEINLLYKEKDAALQFGRTGARDHKRLALEIRKQVKDLKPRLRVARLKAKPGNPLPDAIKAELAHLKKQVIRFKRLHAAAPFWRVVLAKHQKQVPTIERRLVQRIQADLTDRNFKMLGQLEEIAENNQLIEVEIFNGASQDIIWQNAHPDYKEIAKTMKEEQQGAADKVWDWGRSPAADSDTESGEIWEDELGSFKASLYDNCSSKDRYLAIKRRSR